MSFNENKYKYLGLVSASALAGGAGFFMFKRFHICNPEQFLIRTGLGIKDMAIGKHGVQWPFQKATFINMDPITYQFNLHNMSKEKVEFKLPVVFTVGPIDPRENKEEFKNYARIMNNLSPSELEETLGGMIEGEARGLTAQMTIEEMFSNKDVFRDTVVKKISNDLSKLGMRVFNANIKEMSDYDEDNKYFEYRKQRAIQTANYEAQVEVAKAKQMGEVGVEKNDGEIRIAKALIEQEAKIKENEREKAIALSNAELNEIRAESMRRSEVARIESEMIAKTREMEMQRELDEKRRDQQTEKFRSEQLSKTIAESESMERMADADKYKIQQHADGKFYSELKEAEADKYKIQQHADGKFYSELKEGEADKYKIEQHADGTFHAELKEAEAILAKHNANADGLDNIMKTMNNEHTLMQFYLGLNSGIYPKLAEESAKAVRGLNPKINIWNTGSDAQNNNDIGKPIINLLKSFGPALDGLDGHVKLPEWLPTKPLEDKK